MTVNQVEQQLHERLQFLTSEGDNAIKLGFNTRQRPKARTISEVR